ncbi:MAG: SRPBCC family protein [Bacteroidia bacterium]
MKKFLKYFVIVIVLIVVIFFSLGLLFRSHQYTISTTVNAPVEKTFAIFNDTTKLHEWLTGFKYMENIRGKPNEVGSKWKVVFVDHGKEISMNETVTAFKQDELVSFNIANDFMKSKNEIRFIPKGNSTEIIAKVSYRGTHIIQKSILTLFSGSVKKQQEESYILLKQLVERSN